MAQDHFIIILQCSEKSLADIISQILAQIYILQLLQQFQMQSQQAANLISTTEQASSKGEEAKQIVIEGNLQLKVTFSTERIMLEYMDTNQNYETYIGEINKQNYQDYFSKISIFVDFAQFNSQLKEEKIKIEKSSQKKLNFLIFRQEKVVKIPFNLLLVGETQMELLQKQIRIYRTKIDNYQSQKGHLVDDVRLQIKKEFTKQNQRLQQQWKVKESQYQKAQSEMKKKLNKIYQDKCKFKPIGKQNLLKETFFDNLSKLALPNKYQVPFKNFRRFLVHWPKYIVSVLGDSKTGKSTLLCQMLQQNNFYSLQMNQEKVEEGQDEDEESQFYSKIFKPFPVDDSPFTFFDTFYCFNQEKINPQIARYVRKQDLIIQYINQQQGNQTTMICQDRLQFQSLKFEDLEKNHRQARKQLKEAQNQSKIQILQNRFQVLTCNRNIFADKRKKYRFLNKYVTLFDRVGIDDEIFQKCEQSRRQQLQKVKNGTICYCINAAALMINNEKYKKNLLQLLKTNDFQKIILCINCNKTRFSIDKNMADQDYYKKFAAFLEEMIQVIPKFIKELIESQISELYKRYDQIEKSLENKNGLANSQGQNMKKNKEEKHSQEQNVKKNEEYKQMKTIRLKISLFQDQQKKYVNICNMLEKYTDQLKVFDIKKNGTNNGAFDLLEQIIDNYPFKNVYFYGLENFEDKFPILKKLKHDSKDQFYKKIGNQALSSIQKFYANKIQNINDFHNRLSKYYINLPNVIRYCQKLHKKNEQAFLFCLKKQLIILLKSWKKILEKVVQNMKNSNNKVKSTVMDALSAGNLQNIRIFHEFRTKFDNYKQGLVERIKGKTKKALYDSQTQIKDAVTQITSDIQIQIWSGVQYLIGYWNKLIQTAEMNLNTLFHNKQLVKFYIPLYLGQESSSYYKNKHKAEQKINIYNETQQKENMYQCLIKGINQQFSFEFNKQSNNQKLDAFLSEAQRIAVLADKFIRQSQTKLKINKQQQKEEQNYMLFRLMNSQQITDIWRQQKKNIENALIELKKQYWDKLKVVNYDAVLNCVNKQDEHEEQKRKGWSKQSEAQEFKIKEATIQEGLQKQSKTQKKVQQTQVQDNNKEHVKP